MNKKLCLVIAFLLIVLVVAGLNSSATAAGSDSKDTKAAVSVKQHSNSGEDFLTQIEREQHEEEKPHEESVFITAISFIFKLALVLGLAFGTILVLKRFSNMKTPIRANHSRIKVIENSSLGANKALHLIEVGSKKLLIASTPNQITLLAELDANDVVEDNSQVSSQSFKEQLSTMMGTGAKQQDVMQSAKTVAEMLRESTTYFHGKVKEVGRFRKQFRRNDNE